MADQLRPWYDEEMEEPRQETPSNLPFGYYVQGSNDPYGSNIGGSLNLDIPFQNGSLSGNVRGNLYKYGNDVGGALQGYGQQYNADDYSLGGEYFDYGPSENPETLLSPYGLPSTGQGFMARGTIRYADGGRTGDFLKPIFGGHNPLAETYDLVAPAFNTESDRPLRYRVYDTLAAGVNLPVRALTQGEYNTVDLMRGLTGRDYPSISEGERRFYENNQDLMRPIQAMGEVAPVGIKGVPEIPPTNIPRPRLPTGEELRRFAADESGSVRLGKQSDDVIKNDLANLPRIKSTDKRISTRFPTAVQATENPLTHHLSIGLDEFLNSPAFEHNVGLLSKYPGYRRLSKMDPVEAANAYIDQSADNLVWLYKNSPDVMKERSPLWYDGANRISSAFAEKYGIPRQSASAALASLSPQMDWFKNASLAERVGDIIFGPTASKRITPEMMAYAKSQKSLTEPENALIVKAIKGKRLSDLSDPVEQAMWIRLYDEAHNPRAYRSITPEGNYGDFILNKSGEPSKVAWSSFDNIAKAVEAYNSGGDMDVISPLLGNMHKVRSFYNNIEVPNDKRFGDVTADTHQVAAAQLRPLSGNTTAVSHNLATGLEKSKQPKGYVGARSSSLDGVMGTYALNAEATRRAAQELGMLPRQAQSSTWEPIRELFTDVFKRSKNASKVDEVWQEYDKGKININQARKRILGIAEGFGTPDWAEPDITLFNPKKSSTYR